MIGFNDSEDRIVEAVRKHGLLAYKQALKEVNLSLGCPGVIIIGTNDDLLGQALVKVKRLEKMFAEDFRDGEIESGDAREWIIILERIIKRLEKLIDE